MEIKWTRSYKTTTLKDFLKKDIYVPKEAINDTIDVAKVFEILTGSCDDVFDVKAVDDTTSADCNNYVYLCGNYALWVSLYKLYRYSQYKIHDNPFLYYTEVFAADNNGLIRCESSYFWGDDWVSSIEDKVEAFCQENKVSREKLSLLFEKNIKIGWEQAEYCGDTIDLHFNGGMTIKEFQDTLSKIYKIKPIFMDNRFKPYPPSVSLSDLGVQGERVIKIPPHVKVHTLDSYIKENIDAFLELRYIKRSWAEVDASQYIKDVEKLPSFWKSFKNAIVHKFFMTIIRMNPEEYNK